MARALVEAKKFKTAAEAEDSQSSVIIVASYWILRVYFKLGVAIGNIELLLSFTPETFLMPFLALSMSSSRLGIDRASQDLSVPNHK